MCMHCFKYFNITLRIKYQIHKPFTLDHALALGSTGQSGE